MSAYIGAGYGSEFHLMRYLGRYRNMLNGLIEMEIGGRVVEWLDFFPGTDADYNIETSEIGTCSSRDDFFGKKGGEFKPISEVDATDIKKKSFTNWANRIIKKLLGLSFTWEELSVLSNNSISRTTVKTVQFAQGSKGGNTDSPETKSKRDEIRKMLLLINDGEEASAKKMLEEMTAFQGTNGPVKGKNNVQFLSEKQVPMIYNQLKKKVEDFNKQLDAMAAKESQ